MDGCRFASTLTTPTSHCFVLALQCCVVKDIKPNLAQITQRRRDSREETSHATLMRCPPHRPLYIEFSTKCSARKARGSAGCKVFQLSSNSPLPPQNQVLRGSAKAVEVLLTRWITVEVGGISTVDVGGISTVDVGGISTVDVGGTSVIICHWLSPLFNMQAIACTENKMIHCFFFFFR
ncbi:hypothetical protein ACOMHN_053321 [Nucella lapillus]